MKKLTTAVAALGVLGAAALTIAGNANAEKRPPAIATPIKAPMVAQLAMNCGSVAASKTQALGTNQIGVSASSTTSYGVTGCDSFVVDTTVTSASTPAGGYQPPFGYSHEPGAGIGVPDKAKCESTVISVSYWKKLNGATAF